MVLELMAFTAFLISVAIGWMVNSVQHLWVKGLYPHIISINHTQYVSVCSRCVPLNVLSLHCLVYLLVKFTKTVNHWNCLLFLSLTMIQSWKCNSIWTEDQYPVAVRVRLSSNPDPAVLSLCLFLICLYSSTVRRRPTSNSAGKMCVLETLSDCPVMKSFLLICCCFIPLTLVEFVISKLWTWTERPTWNRSRWS